MLTPGSLKLYPFLAVEQLQNLMYHSRAFLPTVLRFSTSLPLPVYERDKATAI